MSSRHGLGNRRGRTQQNKTDGVGGVEIGHNVALSKSLSHLLRHGAVSDGLKVNLGGWIDLEAVLSHERFKRWTAKDVEKVVEINDKQRFGLRKDPVTGVDQIRANQGHSFQVDLELEEITEPTLFPIVIHGTYLRHWDSISTSGLSRMNRNHIHFAAGEPCSQGVISGMRKSAEIFVYLDLTKSLHDGLKFFRSENNVILSPGNAQGFIERKYFSKVLNVKEDRIIFEAK